MGRCADCGSTMSGRMCPNCHEELYIFTTQYDDLPDTISDDFKEKVDEQKVLVNRRR